MARRKRILYKHINTAVMSSPLGPLTAFVAHGIGTPALCMLLFGHWPDFRFPCMRQLFRIAPGVGPSNIDPLLHRTQQELDEYFACERTRFTLPVVLKGTPMQEEVWRALMEIPHGQTVSYGEIAARIGRPESARAVGQAVHANRIPIVIPCHRVLAAGGKIGGYSGGVERKEQLLEVERGVPLLATRKRAVGEGPRLRLVR